MWKSMARLTAILMALGAPHHAGANATIDSAVDYASSIRFSRIRDASDRLDVVRARVDDAQENSRERYFLLAAEINHEIIQDEECDRYDLTTFGQRADDALSELGRIYSARRSMGPLKTVDLERAQSTTQRMLNVRYRLRVFSPGSTLLEELPLEFFREKTFRSYLDYLYSCPNGVPAKDEASRKRAVCSEQCNAAPGSVITRSEGALPPISGLRENINALKQRLGSCPGPRPL